MIVVIIIIVVIAILFLIALAVVLAAVFSSDHLNGPRREKEQTYDLYDLTEMRGRQGEQLAKSQLQRMIAPDEYLLSSVLLPLSNGKRTEVDFILLSKRGIFCIEVKNWVGTITGKEEDNFWLQEYDDRRKESKTHRNPVMQNENHCEVLFKLLRQKHSINNVVLFINENSTRNIESEYVFDINEFKYEYDQTEEIYSAEELKSLYSQLSSYQANEEEQRKFHQAMSQRYHDRK